MAMRTFMTVATSGQAVVANGAIINFLFLTFLTRIFICVLNTINRDNKDSDIQTDRQTLSLGSITATMETLFE